MVETITKVLRRSHERVNVALPVHLETGEGRTWNISASGIYFETDAALAEGSPISFQVEFNSPGGKLMLQRGAHRAVGRQDRRGCQHCRFGAGVGSGKRPLTGS